MALGTVASKPDCILKIIPVGMNYFHAHKFRSRAVIEFGTAIDVPAELAKKFDGPGRRDAIGEMLENVRQGLISVTVTTPVFTTPKARSCHYRESSSLIGVWSRATNVIRTILASSNSKKR
jgi:hypothetical protein